MGMRSTEVQLIIAGVSLVSGLIGWFGRGLSFILTRWWTSSAKHERAVYLNAVAEFGSKLRSSGMTITDVTQLEEIMGNPTIGSSEAAVNAVVGSDGGDAPETNYAMKMRVGAAYEVAVAQLNQALTDLRLRVRESEWEQIEKTQEKWEAYRTEVETCALLRYEGGTHAGLAVALAGLAETERRTAEIEAEVEERSRL